ncbi:MAG TPA: RagB/SusD family nutrient uptake outer membrane protein [Chitinophagaceae bacterium]|nr:RagB/SusD family nutrient uptake outer membrane protein [Chitinophagaceae bacterium]
MKYIVGLCAGICLITILSCKKNFTDFLDQAPGVDVTENSVFSSVVNTERYVSSLYQMGMASIFLLRDAPLFANPITGVATGGTLVGTLSGATDESENQEDFTFVQAWNSAGITVNNIITSEDFRYYGRWKAVRIANILLERIGEVPDADENYKKQVRGEAQFFRALQFFENLKRYGGFPILTKRFENMDSLQLPRSTLEECVNAIVKDCDDAISNLPDSYPTNQTGRATKLAARALKSRTLLYAASPQFNTATPYLSMVNPADNKLISYGNFDAARWKKAADAAKDVLDAAASIGVALIDVPANRDPSVANRTQGNYWVAWELKDNAEVIFADKTYGPTSRFSFPWLHIVPNGIDGAFWTGNSVTHNFVKKYENKITGLPEVWDNAGGNDLTAKYNRLDPRFKQTVAYNGARWNGNVPVIETFTGTTQLQPNKVGEGRAWMIKHIPEALGSGNVVPSTAIYRLNEFYLNYAEALNEFEGPTSDAYAKVNAIRLRSGMPPLPAGLSKNQFRTRVQNERDIELAFEDHRFWDIRRWLIAENEGVMKGDFYGLNITKVNATTFSWVPYVFETRTFKKEMYLHPYPLSEVLKGSLVQNPGW